MDYAIQTPLQLSSHLRALRKARGLSQAELGLALGVGQTRVARIEGSPTAISVDQLLQLLSVLGVQLVLRDPELAQAESPTGPSAKRGTPKPRTPKTDW
ncbi:MAG: helix-turn-helix transcriptional regulator [Burkholderiaceae bacterium]|nr:helix-turn-helix transcriptional regulator [Burkholderiaceae bacterium]